MEPTAAAIEGVAHFVLAADERGQPGRRQEAGRAAETARAPRCPRFSAALFHASVRLTVDVLEGVEVTDRKVALLAQPRHGGPAVADPQLVLGVGEPAEVEGGHRVVPCSYLLVRISVLQAPLVHAMSVARGTDTDSAYGRARPVSPVTNSGRRLSWDRGLPVLLACALGVALDGASLDKALDLCGRVGKLLDDIARSPSKRLTNHADGDCSAGPAFSFAEASGCDSGNTQGPWVPP